MLGVIGVGVAAIVIPVWPGRYTFDADFMERRGRNGGITDTFSPVLEMMWRPFGRLGVPFTTLLVVQVAVILLGMVAVMRCGGCGRRSALITAAALAVTPMVLAPLISVQRDSWFVGISLAMIVVLEHPNYSTRRRAILMGVGLILLIAARQNGVFVALPLVAVFAWRLVATRLTWRPAVKVVGSLVGAALAILVTLGGMQVWERLVGIKQAGPEAVAMLADLDEMSTRVGEVLIPRSASNRQLTLDYLSSTSPFRLHQMFYVDQAVDLFPEQDARAAIREAWTSAVRTHTGDYLGARWQMFSRQIGLSGPPFDAFIPESGSSRLHPQPSFPTMSSWVSDYLGMWTTDGQWWIGGWIHRAWLWLAVAWGVAWWRRGIHLLLATMATAHLAGLFIVAPSVQYRFVEPAVVWAAISVAMAVAITIASSITARTAATINDQPSSAPDRPEHDQCPQPSYAD